MTKLRPGVLVLAIAGAWVAFAPGRALAQKRQKDVIAREEIEASPKRTDFIYDVIRSSRPNFLEPPRGVRTTSIGGAAPGQRPGMGSGGSAPGEVQVFVDQAHIGGIDMLKNILAEQVEEVRYYDPSRAEAEFGLTLGGGGAIVLKMYKPKPTEKPSAAE